MMKDEIVNRVASSKLITIDLEDYYPKGHRYSLDISQWLLEGIVLREKEFRAFVSAHDWSQYKDGYLAIGCQTDAIVPAWAYMLVCVTAAPYVKKVVVGNQQDLETVLYAEILEQLDVLPFRDLPVIIKGCAHKPIPQNAYTLLAQKLQPVAKSVMYGEACSAVPLFKRPKLTR
jgi:hypothetical protein